MLVQGGCGGSAEEEIEAHARADQDSLQAAMDAAIHEAEATAAAAAAAAAAAGVDSVALPGAGLDHRLEELYCCTNHTLKHCGTLNELEALSTASGCSGFQ